MTVIAWDGKHLAADRSSNFSNQRVPTTKVFQGTLPNGTRVIGACSGSTVHCREIQAWVLGGCVPADMPTWQRSEAESVNVIVIEEGCPFPLLYQNSPTPVRCETSRFAWGSGGDFAHGALMAGASAGAAVDLACQWVRDCGLGVDVVSF